MDPMHARTSRFGSTLLLALLSLALGLSVHTRDARAGDPPVAPAPAWNAATPVGDIVAVNPATARIFELVDIDYCCGGETPLGEAAAARSIDLARLLGALAVVGRAESDGTSRNWQTAPLTELLDHIVATHHEFLRRELPRLTKIAATVHRVHGQAHPELAEVEATIRKIQAAVTPHLALEEKQVFPAVRAFEAGEPPANLHALLKAMRTDHDEVGAALHRLRDITGGFAVPEGGCRLYQALYAGLAEFEHDLHGHVHLENNVLLPRATAGAPPR